MILDILAALITTENPPWSRIRIRFSSSSASSQFQIFTMTFSLEDLSVFYLIVKVKFLYKISVLLTTVYVPLHHVQFIRNHKYLLIWLKAGPRFLSVHAVVSATVLESPSLGFSPIPKQGSSLAMASLNLGCETAYTRGLRQLASLATNPGIPDTAGVNR